MRRRRIYLEFCIEPIIGKFYKPFSTPLQEMGAVMSCCGCKNNVVDSMDKRRAGGSESVALVEDDSWKKWSSFNAASLAEDQSYQPPSYVGQFSAEAAWEL